MHVGMNRLAFIPLIVFYEFPMHVGMNRRHVHVGVSVPGVPHARGDEPEISTRRPFSSSSSPCTWG